LNIEHGRISASSFQGPLRLDSGPPSKEALRLRLYGVLLLIDTLALLGGMAAAGWIRTGSILDPFTWRLAAVMMPLYLGIALNSRAYVIDVLTDAKRGVYRAILSLIFAAGAVLLIGFYLRASGDLSRFIFGAGVTLGAGLLTVSRFIFGRVARRLCGASPLSEVVIKDGADCQILPGTFVLDAYRAGLWPRLDDPMMFDRLGRYLKKADRVIVACPPERRAAWAMMLKGANVSGEVLAPELNDLGAIGINRYGTNATMRVSSGPLGLRERALKRLLDLSLAVGALLMLSPLMLAVAAAVKFTSEGPVFFRQKRIGRGNRLFDVYKFRSMRSELGDAAGNRSASRDDDRITPVGRVIRATSIDELPQLLNILKGDMSFVGPRPHALGSTAENKLFWEVDNRYWHRHASKPGLTGLAQIRGYRGATHKQSDLTNRLQADLEYMSGWTIWRDIYIIIKTFTVVIHKNAY
jgi:lipopolysaccharide/colanic/teichoic acid biosynthesis glycosyltransferase